VRRLSDDFAGVCVQDLSTVMTKTENDWVSSLEKRKHRKETVHEEKLLEKEGRK